MMNEDLVRSYNFSGNFQLDNILSLNTLLNKLFIYPNVFNLILARLLIKWNRKFKTPTPMHNTKKPYVQMFKIDEDKKKKKEAILEYWLKHTHWQQMLSLSWNHFSNNSRKQNKKEIWHKQWFLKLAEI